MKKRLAILVIVAIVGLVVLLITIELSGITNEDYGDNTDVDVGDDLAKFFGTWNDIFYSLDDKTSGEWTFYDDGTIKVKISGFTYDGEAETEISWYDYKLEDGEFYLKLDQNMDFMYYDYVFYNDDTHLTLTGKNSAGEKTTISLNKT